MEGRNKRIVVFKSGNPEKLVVFQASSLADQIRFFFNETQYVAAIEKENKCLIELGEEDVNAYTQKSTESILKENFKKFIAIFAIDIILVLLGISALIYLSNKMREWEYLAVLLIGINLVFFIVNTVNMILLEIMDSTFDRRSKHSAEHMMVNFIQTYRRLPKELSEVKSCSRFSSDCGTRILVEGTSNMFIQHMLASIFTIIIIKISSYITGNIIVYIIIFCVTCCIAEICSSKLIKKKKLDFIIKPINILLANLVECANTTSKVKDKDIELAYHAAEAWMKIAYPEFYQNERKS